MADWTIHSLLQTTAAFFKKQGLPSARLDADVLLADTLGMKRLELYMYADKPLLPEEVDAFRERVKRRAQREPVAYIVGSREFYSLEMAVGPGVLIPRPETELLVDKALETLKAAPEEEPPPLLLDLCTGSGAVPIAILKNHASARAIGADLDAAALAFAKRNVATHGLEGRLGLVQGDLFAPIPERFRGAAQVVTANPPYLTEAEMAALSPEVAFEPRLALDGGAGGLELYRRLAAEAGAWLRPGGTLLMEIGAGQGDEVAGLLRAAGWKEVEILPDLAKLDRVASATR